MSNSDRSDSGLRDNLFASPQARIDSFVFDERVAAVFSDMISRSVPGYATIIGMIGLLAEQHAIPGSRLYDLGCSLGAATVSMGHAIGDRECQLVAVDNAKPMLDKAREQFSRHLSVSVETHCADIRKVVVCDASVVVLNFTLQFLPVEERLPLLRNICRGMYKDGVLILSEKIAGADAGEDRLLVELHHAFKRANGYSDLEVS
ncbi:carboxy-S-adenosyl-L-methionine synthase CmoA, partial [Thiolapillus sp.]